MVIIDNLFIHFKQPEQYVYAGENYMDVFKYVNKSYKKTRRFEDVSIFNADAGDFSAVINELGTAPTGIIMNSGFYIFNIFDFEKIPLREETRKELVEWRLKKVFPENIDDYNHQYFRLSKTKILSVLFKNEYREKIEALFRDNNTSLIYVGNSTINAINRIFKMRGAPDFFVEIDNTLATLAFQAGALPYYIRKFRTGSEEDVAAEILKTINYSKTSYSQSPHTFSILTNHSHLNLDVVKSELAQQEISHLSTKGQEEYLLPL